MSNTIKNNLPPVRRIVTGHNEQGMAKVWKDEVVPQTRVGNHSEDYVSFALPWTSNSSPADVQTEVDGATLPIGELTNDEGSVLRYVDMCPGHESPMHRTLSLDYGFVVCGEISLKLPDGSLTPMNPGDVCVQRGTDHSWVNTSKTQWARMAFVLLPSKPIVINGEELGAKSIH